MNIEQRYRANCSQPTHNADIWEHLPKIASYAERVKTICEIGIRTGNSTSALLYGLSKNGGQYTGYDKAPLFTPPEIPGVRIEIKIADTQQNGFEIEPCELFLIDGSHEYAHVTKDLFNHKRVSKFIIMHDTAHGWIRWGGSGVYRALHEFLISHLDKWRVIEQYENCNGLTIMERVT